MQSGPRGPHAGRPEPTGEEVPGDDQGGDHCGRLRGGCGALEPVQPFVERAQYAGLVLHPVQVPGPQRQSAVGLAQHDLSEQAPAVVVGQLARARADIGGDRVGGPGRQQPDLFVVVGPRSSRIGPREHRPDHTLARYAIKRQLRVDPAFGVVQHRVTVHDTDASAREAEMRSPRWAANRSAATSTDGASPRGWLTQSAAAEEIFAVRSPVQSAS